MSNEQFRFGNDAQLLETIRDILTRLGSLEGRSGSIPIMNNDPSADSGITLWLLADGRLRSRRPDGIVMEYATTTPKAVTSYEPLPEAEYQPGSYLYNYSASWQQAYKSGGATPHNNPAGRMYYGYDNPTDGQYKSMMGFPNLSELAPIGGGVHIDKVELYIDNRYSYLDTGVPIKIGTHNKTVAPATFSEVSSAVAEVTVQSVGAAWYELPVSIGNALSAGTITGLTFNQNSTNHALYGYADSAKLRISHTK